MGNATHTERADRERRRCHKCERVRLLVPPSSIEPARPSKAPRFEVGSWSTSSSGIQSLSYESRPLPSLLPRQQLAAQLAAGLKRRNSTSSRRARVRDVQFGETGEVRGPHPPTVHVAVCLEFALRFEQGWFSFIGRKDTPLSCEAEVGGPKADRSGTKRAEAG